MRATLPFFLAIGLAIASACGRTASSSEWPTRPVKLIVPFGPGSGSDVVARLLAPRLSERWRQPVVVDNRPGADGIAGVQAFAAATDHHTLLFTPAGQVTLSPLLHEQLPFDPVADLVPIAAVVNPSIGIATTSSGAASLSDLVSRARQEPDRLMWAAVPGLPEVIFKAFLAIEKLRMKYVPYRDMSVALQDLGAERIQVLVGSVPTLSPLLQSGRARLLVVTTSERISAAPEVPTTTEAGYPALSADGKWGFYGWRGIPDALRERISQDIHLVLDDPALVAKLSNMGLTVAPGTAEEFTRAIDRHRERVQEMARIIGLKPRSSDGGR